MKQQIDETSNMKKYHLKSSQIIAVYGMKVNAFDRHVYCYKP